MALNRLVIGTLFLIAAAVMNDTSDSVVDPVVSGLYAVYMAGSLAIIAAIIRNPAISTLRRGAGLFLDLAAIGITQRYGGAGVSGFMYIAYLLIIFGNGFRFGGHWLLASSAGSILSMSLVIQSSPSWQGDEALSRGLLIGLMVLPGYAHELFRKLQQAKARAESLAQAKGIFLASVSHELRTPLNAVMGLSDLLRASNLSSDDADMVRTIRSAAGNLLEQINTLLDYSRLEAGLTPVSADDVDLYQMLHALRHLLGPPAHAKAVQLRLHVEPNVPQFVRMSSRHIRDSLVNLIGNATKFTSEGVVLITVAQVAADDGKCRLRFEVSDTGIGISEAAQKKIFDRFIQADETIMDNYGGTGLGLAIVKQSIEAIGGTVGVSSVTGQGSIFWFEADVRCARTSPVAPSHIPLILLCSVDIALRDALRLAGVDVRLVRASACAEQVSAMRAISELQPAVIIDFSVDPVMSAMLARDLASHDIARAPCVIAIGSSRTNEDTEIASICLTSLDDPSLPNMLNNALALVGAGSLSTEDMPAPTPDVSVKGMSILVAEDNRTNQIVVRKVLNHAGHSITMAANGEEALEYLNTQSFDIVLMDVNMPVLNGIDATRRYLASEREFHVPIIALTADATTDIRARCLASGMKDCVTKPILPQHLLAVISREARHCGKAYEVAQNSDRLHSGHALSALNSVALNDLERLGGRDFACEVTEQFLDDATIVLASIADAIARCNVGLFHDEAYALRSCAANVGASEVYNLCLQWRDASSEDIWTNGASMLAALETAFRAYRSGLLTRFEQTPIVRTAAESYSDNVAAPCGLSGSLARVRSGRSSMAANDASASKVLRHAIPNTMRNA